ncbi:MAG TPA: polysaccharide biosynthesis tyrosine autokinase [Noviherbaspirillum sp.]|jgi:tyrosine-protein kinase Etk/Wzc|uniref:polysaccharide biosynthesis tyrosine autokinase n=1 Tax=Noviherbaspirillum sp. TaxID=1926288 RepID=UPI002F94E458
MNQLMLPAPPGQVGFGPERNETSGIVRTLGYLAGSFRLIATVTMVCILAGILYALAATPLYESNLLVQVEDMNAAGGSVVANPRNIQGDLSGAFDIRTATASEIEILRSRAVVARAVENAKLYIDIAPQRFPVIGDAIARYNNALSDPGLLGYGGYAWGAEQAQISRFNVPERLEGKRFMIEVGADNRYRLSCEDCGIDQVGTVGETLIAPVQGGQVILDVSGLAAKPGARFDLVRMARLETVKQLQTQLRIAENGKQSGIIGVTLQGSDPKQVALILNEIGREYIQQNLDRKSEKAKKSLAWLDRQLPDLKQELDTSENRYRELRHRTGAIDISEEAKTLLQQSYSTELRLSELNQKKLELLTRYETAHPAIQAITVQERALDSRIALLNKRIRELPALEQEMLRLSRDVKVNTELYTTLLSTAQQLRLATSSEVGNARLLDPAALPVKPVKPHRLLIVTLAALAGVLLGIAVAVLRKMFFGRVGDPEELEHTLGLPVSAAIPHSENQERLRRQALRFGGRQGVLPHDAPDGAVESMRGLRAALQFTMLDAPNNIIMITGPTKGVGKSFVSANLASILASIGKRVLLIDADLRAGDLHRYFAVGRDAGLADALQGEPNIDKLIRRNATEGLDFLPTGTLPSKPAELLAHPRFKNLLQLCAERYDYVLIDTAPVLAVSDALAIAPIAGVILNVVRGGVSTVSEVEESVKRLSQTGRTVTGVVLNNSKSRHAQYSYGYGQEHRDENVGMNAFRESAT